MRFKRLKWLQRVKNIARHVIEIKNTKMKKHVFGKKTKNIKNSKNWSEIFQKSIKKKTE